LDAFTGVSATSERPLIVTMMKRVLVFFLLLTGAFAPALSAAQIDAVDISFDEQAVVDMGYPLVEVRVSPDGIEAPSELAPGFYHVRLIADGDFSAYLDIVQPPAGLSTAEEEEQMLLAGAMDLPQEGWTYLGGTNTFEVGVPSSFVIELAEGDYKFAASYYGMEEGSEEIMRLVPLTVSSDVAADATPAAAMTAPDADVTLEMTDDPQYIVTPDTIPTGSQVWKFENTGTERSHHVVIVGVPDGTTADDIINEFNGLMMGTPPADDSLMMQFVGSGYAAMQSPGTVTWTAFNHDPGTYAVICFIMDDEQSMPHMMDGMVTVFEVE
jgi:hypothetical protein